MLLIVLATLWPLTSSSAALALLDGLAIATTILPAFHLLGSNHLHYATSHHPPLEMLLVLLMELFILRMALIRLRFFQTVIPIKVKMKALPMMVA